MAKTIALTGLQRLKLQNILAAQVGAAGVVFTIGNILGKISLSPEDRERIGYSESQVGDPVNGYLLWSVDAARDAAWGLDLEDAEYGRLRAVLQQWDKFSPADAPWLKPLAGQMDLSL